VHLCRHVPSLPQLLFLLLFQSQPASYKVFLSQILSPTSSYKKDTGIEFFVPKQMLTWVIYKFILNTINSI
jgi:hypothetical protein